MDPVNNQRAPSTQSAVVCALPAKTMIGFLLAVVAVVIIALLSYQSLQSTALASRNLAHSVEVLGRLESLLSTLTDAETGQRGFLLTGEGVVP